MDSRSSLNLLVVDDDPLIHQSLKLAKPSQWKIYSAHEMSDVDWNRHYHAAFVDMHLNKVVHQPTGLRVVEKLREMQSQLDITAMSGDLSRDLMETGLKCGAQRFLSKPLMAEEVISLLEKVEAHWYLQNLNTSRENSKFQWVGNGKHSQEIRQRLAQLKGETNSVSIQGETGTGKEVIARLLNAQEGSRPFIVVNMAGLPEALFESEMFGHNKGSFTGADQNKMGLIEAAHGGDLFLDEIEALPLSQQAKLLRFLENGEVRRVGSQNSTQIKTRVIVASNKNLESMVRDGSFREDLYFRLSSHKILLPSLQERQEDILSLTEYFLSNERPRRNKRFSADGLQTMQNYPWPGNVRELKRVCEQLSLTSPLPMIRHEEVQALLRPQMSTLNAIKTGSNSLREIDLHLGMNTLVERFEKSILLEALIKFEKDIDQTSQILQISRSNLYKKIKDHQIELEKI